MHIHTDVKQKHQTLQTTCKKDSIAYQNATHCTASSAPTVVVHTLTDEVATHCTTASTPTAVVHTLTDEEVWRRRRR